MKGQTQNDCKNRTKSWIKKPGTKNQDQTRRKSAKVKSLRGQEKNSRTKWQTRTPPKITAKVV